MAVYFLKCGNCGKIRSLLDELSLRCLSDKQVEFPGRLGSGGETSNTPRYIWDSGKSQEALNKENGCRGEGDRH